MSPAFRISPSGPPIPLLDAIDSERLLGRDSPGFGDAEEVTIDQALDWIPQQTAPQWIFDGIDDSVLVGTGIYAFERTQQWSTSWWIQTVSSTTQVVIGNVDATANHRGWSNYLFADGHVHFQLENVQNTNGLDVAAPLAINDGQLHHVVVTYAGNSLPGGVQIYIDGVLQVLSTIGSSLTQTTVTTGELRLGIWGSTGQFPTDGTPRQYSIFSGVLTAPQVAALYNGGTPPDVNSLGIPTLLSYWKLDDQDSEGTNGILDYGPGDHDGTAQGGLTLSSRGEILVRETALWTRKQAGSTGAPFLSTGYGEEPAYPTIGSLAFDGLLLFVPFGAGSAGGRDVPVYVSNAPFDFEISDAWLYVTTAPGGTATLRSAASGGGTPYTSNLSTAATGIARNDSTFGVRTVTAGSSLFLRLTSGNAAGQLVAKTVMR